MIKSHLGEIMQAISSGFGGLAFGLIMGWDKSLGLIALMRWTVCAVVISPIVWFVVKEFTSSIAIIFASTAVSASFGYFILMGLFKLAKIFKDKPFISILAFWKAKK
tara:strand:+ start:129 stop:449 length:321 start_codon:yes stop_codon:yes gene_type:complete